MGPKSAIIKHSEFRKIFDKFIGIPLAVLPSALAPIQGKRFRFPNTFRTSFICLFLIFVSSRKDRNRVEMLVGDLLQIEWSWSMVLLSYMISVFGSSTAIGKISKMLPNFPFLMINSVLMEQAIVLRKLKNKSFTGWLAASSLALAGCGIWTMHFTGMNAMSLPVQIGFNIPIVIVSLEGSLVH
jgi:hypothetical protein